MQVEVRGTRLWFDVDGPALVPDRYWPPVLEFVTAAARTSRGVGLRRWGGWRRLHGKLVNEHYRENYA